MFISAAQIENTCDQSYKASTSVNNDSTVINISSLLVITTLVLKFTSEKCLQDRHCFRSKQVGSENLLASTSVANLINILRF